MMSEVIEIGYYRDNVLLTYYAIDVLKKKVRQKQEWEAYTLPSY